MSPINSNFEKSQDVPSDNLWNNSLKKFKRNSLLFYRDSNVLLGTIILIVIISSIILLPLVYTIPPDKVDFTISTMPPSWQHPFGTNDLGQDQLARLLQGGRVSLVVGFSAMVVAICLGTIIGAIAGFYVGSIDTILMRITDIFLSLPQLPLLLLIIYLFSDKIKTIFGAELGIFVLIVLIIGIFNWMSVARLVRASFLKLREMEFVSAANAIGASPIRIIWFHLLPNVINLIVVAATLAVGNAILTESTLSFLGLGFPPDIPTWGRMLFEAKDYLNSAPYMALFPGLAIFLTVLSINYIGDGLSK